MNQVLVNQWMSIRKKVETGKSFCMRTKKYYPDAEEVYRGAEAIVQMEDTQPITDPIIAPVRSKNFDLLEKKLPETTFDFDFLAGLMDKPNLIRNICFLGAMHHGKTLFMDLLVMNTHEKDWN